MRNRLRVSFRSIGFGLVFLLALSMGLGVATALAEQTPREPVGQPQSQFVKDMQNLFSKSGSGSSADSRDMSVRNIVVAPQQFSVWTEKETYRIGEEARIYFRTTRAAYVYILNIDAANRINLIFPNQMDRNSYIDRPGTYSLPRSGYTLPVVGPAGQEHLLLIATSRPLTYLDNLASRGSDFAEGNDPGRVIRLFTDWIDFTTTWSSLSWNSFRVESGYSYQPPRNQEPVVRIQPSATKVTAGTTVTFTSQGSYDPDGSIRYYRWDVNGDGRIDSTSSTARYTYNTPGTYTVSLTLEDNKGAASTATVQIIVEAKKTQLEIASDPKNRAVYVDGVYIGNAPVSYAVSPGSHVIKIIGPGNQTYTTTVDVIAGMRKIKIDVTF